MKKIRGTFSSLDDSKDTATTHHYEIGRHKNLPLSSGSDYGILYPEIFI